uniref:Ubiquitin-like domain-containing protein n=1 Tax=Strigamia maritima TaxID=126957 RepID=T1III1_STRMM
MSLNRKMEIAAKPSESTSLKFQCQSGSLDSVLPDLINQNHALPDLDKPPSTPDTRKIIIETPETQKLDEDSKITSNLRTKTVTPPSIDSMMDPSLIEMMSTTLTEVIMHSELSYGHVLHMHSDHSTRKKSKRNQNCITRTLSLNLEISSTVDGPMPSEEEEKDGPSSLHEAIICKYLKTASTVLEDEPMNASVIISAPARLPSLPATLVLNDCEISHVGDLEQLEPMCRYVRELDLAKNRLNNLCEVEKILGLMNRLTFLNLSSNNLSQGGNLHIDNVSVETMKWLVLNSTYIPCEAVELILACMPNLEELYLSLNGYKHIGMDQNKLADSIHLIHVSGNPITNWEDITKLGQKFPNLETLVMADCLIRGIENDEIIGAAFEKLQSLNISNNKIDSWEEIDKFRSFPSLIDLRLLGLPLLEHYNPQERRLLMIGRLPNIERLNGSRISDLEREDAERAFIRYYMQKPPHEQPNRYGELIAKHGRLDPLANVDLRPKKVIQVVIQYEDKRQLRQISVQQTVGAFKCSLQEFCALPTNQIRLFYVDAEIRDFQGPEELRFCNTKMLYTLNVQDGDEFHIVKKL